MDSFVRERPGGAHVLLQGGAHSIARRGGAAAASAASFSLLEGIRDCGTAMAAELQESAVTLTGEGPRRTEAAPPDAALRVPSCADAMAGAAAPTPPAVAEAAARLQSVLHAYMEGCSAESQAEAAPLIAFAHLTLTTATHVEEMAEATAGLVAARTATADVEPHAAVDGGARISTGEGAWELL